MLSSFYSRMPTCQHDLGLIWNAVCWQWVLLHCTSSTSQGWPAIPPLKCVSIQCCSQPWVIGTLISVVVNSQQQKHGAVLAMLERLPCHCSLWRCHLSPSLHNSSVRLILTSAVFSAKSPPMPSNALMGRLSFTIIKHISCIVIAALCASHFRSANMADNIGCPWPAVSSAYVAAWYFIVDVLPLYFNTLSHTLQTTPFLEKVSHTSS